MLHTLQKLGAHCLRCFHQHTTRASAIWLGQGHNRDDRYFSSSYECTSELCHTYIQSQSFSRYIQEICQQTHNSAHLWKNNIRHDQQGLWRKLKALRISTFSFWFYFRICVWRVFCLSHVTFTVFFILYSAEYLKPLKIYEHWPIQSVRYFS